MRSHLLWPDYRGPVLVSLCAGLDRVGTGVRSPEEYVFLSRHLVATGLPMIVFVDELSMDRLQFLNSYSHIALVQLPKNILSTEIVEKIEQQLAQGKSSPRSTDSLKDTAEYFQLMYSKPWLLEIAATMCIAPTLWWVDFGVAHVCDVPTDFALRLSRTPVDTALLFRDIRPGPRVAAWSAADGLGFVCGGLFGVKREVTSWFVETFTSQLELMLNRQSVPLDEEALTEMALLHPEQITVRNAWHQQLFIGLA
jgi:hypothetical protein